MGWGKDYRNEDFVAQAGVKHQLVNLISSVQTLLRGEAKNCQAKVYNMFSLALFPGPAQLSVTFSMEKWERTHVSDIRIERMIERV